VLNASVLVLNRSFLPIHITTARRAFSLLYRGSAHAVNEHYETFDFDSWSELGRAAREEAIGVASGWIRVPRVILLTTFDRVPVRQVRFNRANIYARDRSTCQYCGRRFARSSLNLDHVVPRSQGGRSTWENVVCSCIDCNRRKGGRTPDQAGLRLIRRPVKPRWISLAGLAGGREGYPEWRPYLSIVDASYWNAKLVDD
jgi:5-methylcytosine-specific restriction endonuclease McrA